MKKIYKCYNNSKCTNRGKINNCSYSETEVIKATGHSYGSWTTTRELTCSGTGEKQRTCSKWCGKETQTIPKDTSKHVWQRKGNKETCKFCGASRTV